MIVEWKPAGVYTREALVLFARGSVQASVLDGVFVAVGSSVSSITFGSIEGEIANGNTFQLTHINQSSGWGTAQYVSKIIGVKLGNGVS